MEQMDAESKRLSQIMDNLKNRNFPSTKMKQGVRVQVQFQDRRDATDMDRDVIVDRINRQTPRGKVVQESPKTFSRYIESLSPEKSVVERSPSELVLGKISAPVSQPDNTTPATKKLSKITITKPISEEAKEEAKEEAEEEAKEEAEEEAAEEAKEEAAEEAKEEAKEEAAEGTMVKTSKPRITQKKSRIVSFVPPETPKEDANPHVRRTEGFGRDADNVVEASIIKITTSPYYMSNRKRFLEKINQLFEPFMQELAKTQEQISCSTLKSMGAAGQKVELLIHQRVAREYLNLYSPYRGLLLFFGLGTGKSLASISIAEGMKSHKKICVMTPASLKMNFFTELKRAGDPLYKKNQSWSFVSTAGQPDLEDILSKKMSLSLDFIRKKKGVWMAETESTSTPFSELSEEDQIAVDKQLDQMIRAKYLDINYNGINHRMMSELTENYTKNPFDNTVIIIDEVHNLVNMIVNQIGRLSKKSENVPTKIGPSTPISLLLYEYIMQAHDARVVFLSGTPIINTPNEIGVLYNMLRGYIKTWTFSLQINTTAKITTETILQMFHKEKFLLLDYVEYSQNKLTITRNPFGFINNTTGKCNSKSSRASALEKGSQKVPTTATAKKDDDITGEPEALAEGFPLTISTPKKTTRKITTTLPKGQRKTKKVTIAEPRDAFPTPNTMVVESEKDEDIYNMDPHEGGGGGNEDVDPNYQGVCLDETGNMDDSKFLAKVKDILKRNGLQVLVTPKVDLFKCLPDRMDAFLDMFIDIDTGMMKQSDMFSRRILGLTSFFKSPQENLLPTLEETDAGESYELVKTEMSTYQFEQYAVIRKEERDKDTNVQKNKKKRGATSGAENAEGLYREFTSTYRIYSRSCCNFAWPDPPGRPITSTKPDKGKLLKSMAEELPGIPEEEEEEEEQDIAGKQKTVPLTKKSLKSSMVEEEEEESTESSISEIPEKEMEDLEKQNVQKSVLPSLKNTQPTMKSLKSSMVEEEEESAESSISEIPEKEMEDLEKQNVQKSVLPSLKNTQPTMKSLKSSMVEEEEEEEEEEEKEEEEKEEKGIHQKGGAEISEEDINLEDMGSKQEKDDEGEISELQVEEAMKQLNQEAFLALSNLSTYSPKYAAILENILSEKHIGLHLVYSSFRTLEGIGIFQLVLENNGFRRFHIQKMADGEWDIEDDILGQPTYALYTGTESTEEKEIIRNIYNGAWDNVPPRIVKKLEAQDKDGKKNTVGDIIKILMITASGAEGINLKNTRYVHIVEPYWNMVRVDQVVGRARRICSHEELPPELRTVKVFLYLSVFSEQQQTDKNYVDLMNSDVSRFNENQPVTTDETLYEISLKKENISKQILNVVKTSSIDCALYQSQGSKEMICYGANLGHIKTNDFLSYPTLNQDAQVQNKQVVTKQRVSFREITIKGKKYHLNESDMNLYEHSEYMANRTNPEKMKSVGKLVKEGKGYKIM